MDKQEILQSLKGIVEELKMDEEEYAKKYNEAHPEFRYKLKPEDVYLYKISGARRKLECILLEEE